MHVAPALGLVRVHLCMVRGMCLCAPGDVHVMVHDMPMSFARAQRARGACCCHNSQHNKVLVAVIIYNTIMHINRFLHEANKLVQRHIVAA